MPPANRWGSPWHTKSLKILRGCTYAASLCKNVTHYHQKLPTRGYRVPKCIPKAHFGELRVTLFLQNLQKWSLPKCMVCTVFSRHLAGCGSSLCRLHAKKTILASWSQLFSAWVVPRRGKFVHWGTQGSPKTPKAAQSDSPGHQKCIQKATLGLYGVPRVPPEVSGALPRRENHKNDIKIQISIKNDG
jgi:hypothetical protein